MRTGASSRLSAKCLARAGSTVARIAGPGVQARTQPAAVHEACPGLTAVLRYEIVPSRLELSVASMQRFLLAPGRSALGR